MIGSLVVALAAAQEIPLDASGYRADGGVKIERKGDALRAEWTADGSPFAATFRLSKDKPLVEFLEANGVAIARDVRPVWIVTTGARVDRPNERYIFFDKPATQ